MVTRIITADFGKRLGKVKPLGGVIGGPRFGLDLQYDLSTEYRDLAVPMVRVADVERPHGGGRYLDIHNIFPDPALDERFPESYNFAPTDRYLLAVKECGAGIYLRLGESLDTYEVRPYLRPRMTVEKLARVCEKIIAHYNMGWGGGYKLGIRYVEIWPCADRAAGFGGTGEEYFELYRALSLYLREKFPKLKIGGYSSGGFFALNHFSGKGEEKKYIDFLEKFLSYVTAKDTKCPLDFLSWECSADSPEELSLHSRYAASYLSQYKLKRTESIISSFRLATAPEGEQHARREYPSELAASLIIAEKSDIDMMFYNSLDPRGSAVITLDDGKTPHPYAAYEVLRAFGALYKCGTAISTTDDFRREIYTLGATSDTSGALLVVTREFSGMIEIEIKGSAFSTYSIKGITGGGKRGEGYSRTEENIPLSGNIKLRAGKCEVYLLTFTA